MPLVAPSHRPTLREELAALPRRTSLVITGLLVLVAAAAAVLLARGTTEDGVRIAREGDVPFNLRYPSAMRSVAPQGDELLRLEREGLDSFMVEPLELPSYQGDVGGILPVVAARELEALKQRFPGLEPVEEGKARINQVAGYSMVFRADRKQRLYGRLLLLPEPEPGARTGVKLLLLANPDAGADKARDVGQRGLLKTPYRSFRFGLEGP